MGCLAQGNMYTVRSTYTIDIIHCHKVSRYRDATYATYVLNYKPPKDEKHRVHITVGGDRLTYLYDSSSSIANIIEKKVLLNSTISYARHSAQSMLVDIK